MPNRQDARSRIATLLGWARQVLVQSVTGDPLAEAYTTAAHIRGMKLLREHLSPSQRAQYEQFNYFEVVGGETGRRYRIRRGHMLNIEVLDKGGHRICVMCFGPTGSLPLGDSMLAQKLALETFEAEVVRVAHISPHQYRRRLTTDLPVRER